MFFFFYKYKLSPGSQGWHGEPGYPCASVSVSAVQPAAAERVGSVNNLKQADMWGRSVPAAPPITSVQFCRERCCCFHQWLMLSLICEWNVLLLCTLRNLPTTTRAHFCGCPVSCSFARSGSGGFWQKPSGAFTLGLPSVLIPPPPPPPCSCHVAPERLHVLQTLDPFFVSTWN